MQIRALDDGEISVWSSWKKDEIWTQHEIERASTPDTQNQSNPFITLDARAPGMGRRILVPSKSPLPIDSEDATEELPLEAYTLRRMLRGVAEGQSEILREVALPQESNIDFMDGIDFRKGCYLGQELTIRTHHTGVVRKRILPCQIYLPDEDVPQGWQPAGEKPTFDAEKGDRLQQQMALPASGDRYCARGEEGAEGGEVAGGRGQRGACAVSAGDDDGCGAYGGGELVCG